MMLSRNFALWVLLANLLAWPTAFFAVTKLLERYAYKTSIGLELIILSGLASLMLAVLTVGFQAVRAAFADPVDSLRYE